MKFTLEIGDKEKAKIEFSRNWFTGAMRAFVDGRQVAQQSPFSIFTHFSFRLRRRYEFMVGSTEKHKIVLEKQRPLLFAGFRSHVYRVFVDDKLVHEQQGF
jgi:hypothetical protein